MKLSCVLLKKICCIFAAKSSQLSFHVICFSFNKLGLTWYFIRHSLNPFSREQPTSNKILIIPTANFGTMTVFPLTSCGVLYYVDQLHTNVNNTENLPPSQKQSYNLIGPFEFQNLLQIRYTGQVGSFNLPGIMTQNRVNTKGKSKSGVQYAIMICTTSFFLRCILCIFLKGEFGISTKVWYIIVSACARCMVAQFNKQKIKAIDGRSLPI